LETEGKPKRKKYSLSGKIAYFKEMKKKRNEVGRLKKE